MMITLARKKGASKGRLYSAPAALRTANQKRQGAPSRLDRIVAMTAQFDVNAARVADLLQRCQHFGEINLALAEHQVIVNAAPHVLDVDVPQPIAPTPQMFGDGCFSKTMQMANVDS